MRKLIAVLAILAAPVAVAPPAPADVPCRAELYSIYANNLNEMDGKDELRFSIGGNLYPTVHKDWVKIASGKTKYSAAFERPSGLISTSTGSAIFSLREVTPPAAGS